MKKPASAALVAAVAALAGCGEEQRAEDRPATTPAPRGLVTQMDAERYGGPGPTGVWVLRPEGRSKGVVLFLHGWTAARPDVYRAWLEHLVDDGRTVVYPQYQAPPFLSPSTAFGALVAGVKTAVAEAELPTEGWVVAGHSAGGAMSADYAASAQELGLPVPRAVVSVYPGRSIRRIPIGLPTLPLDTIPETTDVVVLAGDDDRTVGTTEARRIARETGGRFLLVRDPRLDDHLAPQRERGSYLWDVLDAVLSGSRPSQLPDAP